jgi:hypothetical protein
MSHRSSHTHCQAARAAPKLKPGKECVCPTARQFDKWMEKEALAGNWRLAKKQVQNLNEV